MLNLGGREFDFWGHGRRDGNGNRVNMPDRGRRKSRLWRRVLCAASQEHGCTAQGYNEFTGCTGQPFILHQIIPCIYQ